MSFLTRKPCSPRCLYAIEGHCRLERILGERQAATCPHYEEDYLI